MLRPNRYHAAEAVAVGAVVVVVQPNKKWSRRSLRKSARFLLPKKAQFNSLKLLIPLPMISSLNDLPLNRALRSALKSKRKKMVLVVWGALLCQDFHKK